jgi:4-amino-4-deoxy-L-arabinose transferase-like glycosyltransferase
MLAPIDLFQGDQEKQVGYVMDILHGGKLSVQYEVNGRIATKPPLYNWCAAAACGLTGSTAPWVMKLPALLAAAGSLMLIFLLTRRFFGAESAFWATLAALAAHHFQKLMWFARTDMMLAFTILLAIQASVALRRRWWRSLAVGAILGASFLTKGPVGPVLYVILLFVWAWRQGVLRDRGRWAALLPGLAVFALMAGAWLAAVWQEPQFQQTVLRSELGDRLASGTRRAKPVWYYVPLLFGRIAPWPLVAAGAAVVAWRRRDERWRDVLFVVLWFAAFFAFLSAVPAKRHDLLLPVYPPVFMLSGLGLCYLTGAHSPRWTALLVWALVLSAVAGVVSVAVCSGGGVRFVAGAAGTVACGGTALWLLRSGRRTALAGALLALTAMTGIEGWLGSPETRAYAGLRDFVEPARAAARDGKVVVWRAHPLVSYELGLHERDVDLSSALAAGRTSPLWLITGKPVPDGVVRASAKAVTPAGRLQIKGQGVDATLYRVSAQQPAECP